MRSSERQDVLASPYRGIHPFRYVDQAYFFGREETVAELLAKVLVSRLVLLFGESGTGKSSLINAGLIPALEKEGLGPERLRVRPIPEEPVLIEKIQTGDEDDGRFLPSIFADDKSADTDNGSQVVSCSLEERFLKTIHETDAYPVLIFDQFEELFTLFAQDRGKAVDEEALRADLLDAIFQIVSNESLKAKVIIVIREDFLGKLEILAKNYPQVFDYRVRLGHLDESGAGKAILGPFENTNPFPSRLTPELAERIIEDLSGSQPDVQIQPTQLQIICSRLWEKYAPTRSEITAKEFEKLGKVKGILEGFLESELAEVEPALRSQAVGILGHLITESGTRDDVSIDKLRGLIISEDISQEELSSTLDFLERRRLVNRTHRRGTYYYEIASEYLIPPIQKLTLEQERAEAERLARAKATARFRRIVIPSLIVALLIVGWLALTAFQQRNLAIEEGKKAEAEAASARTAQVIAQDASMAAVEQRQTAEAERLIAEAQRAIAEAASTAAIRQQQTGEAQLNSANDARAALAALLEANLRTAQASTAEAPPEPPTDTPTPSPTATSIGTPPPSPETTPTTTPTASPTPTSNPTVEFLAKELAKVRATQTAVVIVASCVEPQGELRGFWNKYKWELGCPTQTDPIDGYFAEQRFENGYMLWSPPKENLPEELFVVTIGSDIGTWHQFRGEDFLEFQCPDEGVSCPLDTPPPPDRFQPERGFGCIWCAWKDIQESIGLGTEKERAVSSGNLLQEFEHGIILRDSQSWVYILFKDDGTYIRERP